MALAASSLDFTAFERLPASIVVLDAEGAIAWWNQAATTLIGDTLEAWRGRPLTALMPDRAAPQFDAALRELRSRARPFVGPVESWWTRGDGETRRLLLTASTLLGEDDELDAIVVTGLDATDTLGRRDADCARLESLLDLAPDGIFVADISGRYTAVNEAGARMLGYTKAEIVGKTILEFLPTEDAGRLAQSRGAMITGTIDVSEWRLRHKDGTYLPVEVSAKILPDGRWQGFVRDIRERTAQETERRQRAEDLARAQSVAKVGSWRLDVRRNELRWSDENYRIFGVPLGEPMTYGTFLACVHPDDREFVDRKWTAALRGEPYDIEHRLLVAGEVKWVREKADLDIDERGLVRGGIGITLDITDAKRAAEEQRILQERLSAIISLADDAIISVDEGQRIVMFNDAAERIFGWSRDEVMGQAIGMLIPEQQRAAHEQRVQQFANREVSAQKMPADARPVSGVRKDGHEFPAEAAISKIDAGGRRILTVTVRDITERKAIEAERERLLAEIEKERARLATILDVSPMGVLFYEPDGRLYFNRRAEEIFGLRISPTGSAEQYARAVLYPDGRAVPREELASARVVRDGVALLGLEYLIQRPDGSRIPILGSAAPVRDEMGRIVGAVGVFQDVSERMRSEEALRLSEERLRVALAAAPLVVFNQDNELRYTWVHNPSRPLSPYAALGKSDFDLLPPEEAEALVALKRRVLDTGTGEHALVPLTIGNDTEWFDIAVEQRRGPRNEVAGITGAGWNVTRQRRQEEEQRLLAEAGALLMGAARSYTETLSALADFAVRTLADWVIVDVIEETGTRRIHVACADPKHTQIAGALAGVRLDRSRPHLDFAALHESRAVRMPNLEPTDLDRFAQNDEHRELLRSLGARALIAVPLLVHDKSLGALVFISSTHGRRYDERMLHLVEQIARLAGFAVANGQLHRSAARAIAARDEVLGVVAHDLRGPLSTMMLNAELLRRRGAPERRNLKPIDGLRRSAERMNRLIEDILDVARLDAGSIRVMTAPVATRSLLEEAYEAHRENASRLGIDLRLDVEGRLGDVLGDRDRVLQILDNLIGNAEKFTPRDGTIVLGARAQPGAILFSVRDTGPGIPQEQLARIFDRFWQVDVEKKKRRGAGLGLFITKGLVEAHGGRIWMESDVGRGTTCSFTIPLAVSGDARKTPAA